MMKSGLLLGGAVLVFILSLLIAIGWHFSSLVLYPQTLSPEASYELEVDAGRLDPVLFESWPYEEVYITSPYGYKLFGLYIPAPENAAKTVILCHGIANTLYGSTRYVEMFRRRNFNVLLIELRYHGRSGGDNTSYGFYEKHDLRAWVDWVTTRCGPECIVGTHGVSLGASTTLQHMAIDPRVAFSIADCPYASAAEEFTYRLKVEYNLSPFPLIPLASAINKVRAGFFFKDVAPLEDIKSVHAPVLFIHGADDDFIPPEASRALYEAKPDAKQLYLVPQAGHVESYERDPDAYERQVGEFLAENGF